MHVLSKFSKILAISGLCASMAGCAIRPLPGDQPFFANLTNDTSETPTFAIVQHLRCEARFAIAKTTMNFILKELNNLKNTSHDTLTLEFLASITDPNGNFSFDLLVGADTKTENVYYVQKDKTFRDTFLEFLKAKNRKDVLQDLSIVQAFATSGVGFDFTFTGTEDNNASGGMLNSDFPQNIGNFSLGLGGALTRQRQNKRELKIVETIHSIVFDRDLIKMGICNEHNFLSKKNYVHPITGRIGLDDSFSTFANLVLKSTFGNRDVKKGFKSKTTLGELSSQDLTDTITFTTSIEGSANPKVTLNPILTGANLSLASIQLSNKRIDKHELRLIIQETDVAEILDKLEVDSLRDDGVGLVTFGAK